MSTIRTAQPKNSPSTSGPTANGLPPAAASTPPSPQPQPHANRTEPTEKLRLFVAIPVPADVASDLQSVVADLHIAKHQRTTGFDTNDADINTASSRNRPATRAKPSHHTPSSPSQKSMRGRASGRSSRMVSHDRWHLTIAFLGKVAPPAIPAVTDAIRRAAQRSHPIELAIAGGGRFGRGRYSVVWAGIDGDVDALVELALDVRSELTASGLTPDSKQFRPHITLARPGDRITNQQASQDLLTLRRYHGPTWVANQLVLFDSNYGHQPKGEAPAYRPIDVVGL
ncbi:RNA 2',3'-cyclic phosphodiesterase [Natronoglycomyces albus]|uniref:RNA 2',3'-cyclic phosphodiesterase n=1 Tax=Natronoglycomyces albus TaxID=2811108 RepID=A0A895XQN7_9ACTN|nr:RNA 2',3'-cyclic phosphodiesterase [Natronoglycomyces albus]QSB05465.1 RNA 2',3'-cyclic phosphodiesterase [Natronoglycomyces albus]